MGYVMSAWGQWLQRLGMSSWVYHEGESAAAMHSLVTICIPSLLIPIKHLADQELSEVE